MKITYATQIFLLASIVCAGPVLTPSESPNSLDDLKERQEGGEGADGIIALVMLAEDLIANDKNAWDTDIPHSCVIQISTWKGGDCEAAISCGQDIGLGASRAVSLEPGPGTSLSGWEVCYVNGRQFMNDPMIGDFSITFTEAGGVNGNTQDGLHNPILQLAQIGNWQPIDVQGEVAKIQAGQKSGVLCDADGNDGGYTWNCGVPQVGYSNFGLTNTPPITTGTYVPGRCGIHFIEYQIPSGDHQYYLAARVVDAQGSLLAQAGNSYEVGGTKVAASSPVGIDSALPYVVVITVPLPGSLGPKGNTDTAPVAFAYAGQTWGSSDSQCKVGKYDSGARQGDCTFSC